MWLEKRGEVGGMVHECIVSVPPGTRLRHKVRLKLQGRVILFCLLGRSSDMTDDVVAGYMK